MSAIGAKRPASYPADRVDARWVSEERRDILDWASLRAMTVSARLVAKMEVILEDEAPYVGSAAMVDIVAWCVAEEFGIEVLVEKVGVDGMLLPILAV